MSKFWNSLFTMFNVKLTPSSSYHPETDGQTEIVNRKLEGILRENTSPNATHTLTALRLALLSYSVSPVKVFDAKDRLFEPE
jgi:hypothetical protein